MPKEDLRKIKDQAARHLKKGNWEKALEKYEILVKHQPKDLRQKTKLADILVKLKRMEEAFNTYDQVAEAYAADGFLIQAVSIYKIILQLDPKRKDAKEKLERINQARGIPAAKPRPPASPPDAEPGLPGAEERSLEEEIAEARERKEEEQKGEVSFPDTPLFGQLGEEEFTQVVSKFQVGTIPKGTQVITEGTKGDSFFIVSQGDIRVYRTHPKSGKKITLAHLTDGAFFGEMAFFLDSVRTASCETAVETILLRINRKDLEGLMSSYPNIREVMRDFFKRRALDQLFKTMPLFASLEEADRQVLADKMEMVEADLGTMLIQEGEVGEYLWLIYTGEVEVTTQHEEKGPVLLASPGPGDYVGEISLIQGKMNTADVTTSQKSILFKLAKPIFKELLDLHPAMLDELTSTIEERLKNTVQTLLKA